MVGPPKDMVDLNTGGKPMKEKSAREQLIEQLVAFGWNDLGGGYWTHPGYEGGERRADIHQAAAATIHQLRQELRIGGPAVKPERPERERTEPTSADAVGELLDLAMQPEGRLGGLVSTVGSLQKRMDEVEKQRDVIWERLNSARDELATYEQVLVVLCKLALSSAGVIERPTVADLEALERLVRGGL